MRTLAILGATGSIGRQALDVAQKYPDRFRVDALTAYESADALFALVRAFRPRFAGLVVEPKEIPADVRFCEWTFGADCSEKAAQCGADDVLEAVVGAAGLPAALAALSGAKRLLLANKEALVIGGELVTARAKALHKPILPVDSEHSAIFQCLQAASGEEPARLWVTASGGPFRTWNQEALKHASVADVLRHPTWRMGPKVTVDSATLMNKGLEVIEAHHLFSMPLERIEVVVHPQSVIHSMVEMRDGAVLAQMGCPDMRGPISYAMGYPERLPYGGERLDFARLGSLTFEAPDTGRFPCLRYAREAQEAGGTLPAVLNAANERAVAAFLAGKLPFVRIAEVVAEALSRTPREDAASVETVLEADRRARVTADEIIRREP